MRSCRYSQNQPRLESLPSPTNIIPHPNYPKTEAQKNIARQAHFVLSRESDDEGLGVIGRQRMWIIT
jgi:hypothetical protein